MTADEWRQEHYFLTGKPVEPASILADVLAELEEREADIRFLKAAAITHEPELAAKEWS
jgi:hypothetical protein